MTSTDEMTITSKARDWLLAAGTKVTETDRLDRIERLLAELTEAVKVLAAAKKDEADGWIPWTGGMCPVDPGVYVEVRLRDGSGCEGEAYRFIWNRLGPDPSHHIIAWRRA